MPKIIIYVETSKVGSRVEEELDVPDEDWCDLSGWDKDKYMSEFLPNLMTWGFYEKDKGAE